MNKNIFKKTILILLLVFATFCNFKAGAYILASSSLDGTIKIWNTKTGKVIDVAHASDQLNLKALSKEVVKYYMCFPKSK